MSTSRSWAKYVSRMATSAITSARASRRSAAMVGRSASVVRRTADVLHQLGGFPPVRSPGAMLVESVRRFWNCT